MTDPIKVKIIELCPDVMTPEVCDFPSTGGHHVKKFTLAVVLRAIEKANIADRVAVYENGLITNWKSGGCFWNLEHDNYDAQSQETKAFIGNLLGV